MPTFANIEAFEAALTRYEKDLERKRRDMGRAVAEGVRPEAYRAAAADLGGDPKFSGWRGWLELRVRSKEYGAAMIPASRLSAAQWTVAQFGRNTNAGPFARRTSDGGVRTYKRGARAGTVMLRSGKRWNGVTAGKGTADDARARVERAAGPIAEKEFIGVTRRHFDVS